VLDRDYLEDGDSWGNLVPLNKWLGGDGRKGRFCCLGCEVVLAMVSIALGFVSHARADVGAKGANGPEGITKLAMKQDAPSMILGGGK
jgi:hypothetical protein